MTLTLTLTLVSGPPALLTSLVITQEVPPWEEMTQKILDHRPINKCIKSTQNKKKQQLDVMQ